MYTFVYLGLTWTSNHACSLSPVTKITLNVDKGIIIYWAHFQWSIVSFNLLSRTLNTCKSGSTIISLYASISRHNISTHVTGNPRQSWILDSTYWIPDYLSVEHGFRISIVKEVPESLNCIPYSKGQDSEFQAKISRKFHCEKYILVCSSFCCYGQSHNGEASTLDYFPF